MKPINAAACGRCEVVTSRREFLAKSALGFGAMALGHLLAQNGALAVPTPEHLNARTPDPLAPKQPPLPATAKRVIFLFMQGGPSHLDTFDPKPELKKLDGQPLPKSFTSEGLNLQFMKA